MEQVKDVLMTASEHDCAWLSSCQSKGRRGSDRRAAAAAQLADKKGSLHLAGNASTQTYTPPAHLLQLLQLRMLLAQLARLVVGQARQAALLPPRILHLRTERMEGSQSCQRKYDSAAQAQACLHGTSSLVCQPAVQHT